MRTEPVFNPLDKKTLGTSVAEALLQRDKSPLPPTEKFEAAGVYALYYFGPFPPYRPISDRNRAPEGKPELPIYVGKAVPKGSRKGGFRPEAPAGTVLYDRLVQHSKSIGLAANLALEDFYCRFLAVDDVWIPLGEKLLISMFTPLWNSVVDGFGNNQPGANREGGKRPAWHVLHPGGAWAGKLQPGKDEAAILRSIESYFAKHSI
ncbi:MAG: Eco29kI family restriction endonuclease [Bryobacterales bacterium]|nr:Eco29kI family restriction endonuclease [Bryobacterales bacterium]